MKLECKKSNRKKKKIKRKGFTLVELLAVIVVMGILMMVAIPAVTRTIENSRKETFVDIAKSYGNAVRTLWTSDNLTCEGTVSSAVDDGDYYILINSKEGAKESLPVLLDQGGKSSWGNRDVNGYVRVNISTTAGVDDNGDGVFEVEPKRVTKFYVALSDGTHGVIDNNTSTMDELVRGNVNMTLSEEDLKKVELTTNDGKLNCYKAASGEYVCVDSTPVNNISGVCVDDQTSVKTLDPSNINAVSFATDDWVTISTALKVGTHSYQVGDSKTVDMGELGIRTLRISNLTPCDGTLESETACGVILEFADFIKLIKITSSWTNVGGWPATSMRTFLNGEVYNALPADLRSVIIDTKVVSGHGSTAGETNFTSIDKLYLLSSKEVYGESVDTVDDETRQLDYYINSGVTLSEFSGAKKKWNHGSSGYWWLRSAYSSTDIHFLVVYSDGQWTNNHAGNAACVSPAFRIA